MACAVPPHPFASASRKAIAASRATFTERASLLPPAAVGSRPAVADRLKLAGGRGMLAKAARCCSSPKEPVCAHPGKERRARPLTFAARTMDTVNDLGGFLSIVRGELFDNNWQLRQYVSFGRGSGLRSRTSLRVHRRSRTHTTNGRVKAKLSIRRKRLFKGVAFSRLQTNDPT